MSITVLVLIVEVIIILLGLVCFLFFLRWKRKKNKIVELNQLLDDINSREEERNVVLTKHLVKGYALGDEAAKELSSYMVEAEKQFLQQFVKQQIEQSSLTSFYETLCELLDQYLYFIPQDNTEKNLSVNTEQERVCDGQNLDEAPKNIEKIQEKEDIATDPEEIATNEASREDKGGPDVGNAFPESSDEIAIDVKADSEALDKEDDVVSEEIEEIDEPDWGDAFSEAGDEMDADVKAGFEAEDKEKIIVSEDKDKTDEPDWADAFVESGDEVDESTKAGYESEVKKES